MRRDVAGKLSTRSASSVCRFLDRGHQAPSRAPVPIDVERTNRRRGLEFSIAGPAAPRGAGSRTSPRRGRDASCRRRRSRSPSGARPRAAVSARTRLVVMLGVFMTPTSQPAQQNFRLEALRTSDPSLHPNQPNNDHSDHSHGNADSPGSTGKIARAPLEQGRHPSSCPQPMTSPCRRAATRCRLAVMLRRPGRGRRTHRAARLRAPGRHQRSPSRAPQ